MVARSTPITEVASRRGSCGGGPVLPVVSRRLGRTSHTGSVAHTSSRRQARTLRLPHRCMNAREARLRGHTRCTGVTRVGRAAQTCGSGGVRRAEENRRCGGYHSPTAPVHLSMRAPAQRGGGRYPAIRQIKGEPRRAQPQACGGLGGGCGPAAGGCAGENGPLSPQPLKRHHWDPAGTPPALVL